MDAAKIIISRIGAKSRGRESKPCVLKVPVKILADLLKNGGADLRERHLAVFRFSKTPYQKNQAM